MTMRRPSRVKKSGEHRRKRAKPIENWLEFIRPIVDRYVGLPRGEQRDYIVSLSDESKDTPKSSKDPSRSSVNTLRRFIAAAQFLEASGITEFPAGLAQLPVGSVEAVERISRRDPALGQKLLQDLLKGEHTIQSLKDTLANTPKRRVQPGRSGASPLLSEKNLRAEIAEIAGADSDADVVFISVMESKKPSFLFDRFAPPRRVAQLPQSREVVVFDEGMLLWAGSPQRAKLAFLRNIVTAAALFDIVVVYCSALQSDVERVCAAMLKLPRESIVVRAARP